MVRSTTFITFRFSRILCSISPYQMKLNRLAQKKGGGVGLRGPV